MKRIATGIMLTLLLTGMLALAFNVQPVKASGTVYIRADGSIDPPTANITSVDNVTYTFTDNIYDGIQVERSNIIIDGDGYTLQGTFVLAIVSKVTIKNTNIKDSGYGFLLSSYAHNNTIYGNNITNTDYGVYLHGSSNNNIVGNKITNNNDTGIYLYESSNYNNISGNNIIKCVWYNIFLSISSNNNITGNTIAGGPPCYYGVGLEHSSNNSIAENNIIDNGYGIYLRGSSSNNTISGNNIRNNGIGVYLLSSYAHNNTIYGNNITKNQNGVYLEYSSNNRFYHNNFVNNTNQVYISSSMNVWDDGYPSGGDYWSDYNGTDYYSGPYQNETGNDGIGDIPYTIDANNTDNYPLMTSWPTRIIERIVKIGHQNYTITMKNNATITDVIATRNTLHFTTSGPTGQGAYINLTFPVGLNKTAIKVFVDEEKITPPPYPIITANGTHYFIYFEFTLSTHNITIQYAIADIAVTNVVPYKTIVGQGYFVSINVTVENQGDYSEAFNVTVYLNNNLTMPTEDDTEDAWLAEKTINSIYAVDEDWSTYVKGNYSDPGWRAYVYENFTVPSGVGGANWTGKYGTTFSPDWGSSNVDVYCYEYDSESWTQILSTYATSYEDAIRNWTVTIPNNCLNKTLMVKTEIRKRDQFCVGFCPTDWYFEGKVSWLYTNISLPSRKSMTITFTWDSTGFAKGNYTISAYVTPVPGETDLMDNNFTDGTIAVTILGDLNNDCVVDVADVVLVSAVYRYKCGDPEYRPNSDIIEDCVIDIADVVAVTSHYRETC